MANLDNPYAPVEGAEAKSAHSYKPLSGFECVLIIGALFLFMTYCVGLPGVPMPPESSPGLLVVLPFVPAIIAASIVAERGLLFLSIVGAFPAIALLWLLARSGRLAPAALTGVTLGVLNGVLVRLYLFSVGP